MSWDLQSDDNERLLSLGLKAVTWFPSSSSFFESIPCRFFFNKLPGCEDTLRCGFKAKSESRFGFWGPSAQLRTSGKDTKEWLFLSDEAR